MSFSAIALVAEFIRTFEASLDPRLWIGLVKEEIAELKEADEENLGVEAVLKEAADVGYVLTGMLLTLPDLDSLFPEEELDEISEIAAEADELTKYIVISYGFTNEQLQEAFRRVHASNMSKLGDDGKPIRREDGKVLKGPNYKPPVLTDLVS